MTLPQIANREHPPRRERAVSAERLGHPRDRRDSRTPARPVAHRSRDRTAARARPIPRRRPTTDRRRASSALRPRESSVAEEAERYRSRVPQSPLVVTNRCTNSTFPDATRSSGTSIRKPAQARPAEREIVDTGPLEQRAARTKQIVVKGLEWILARREHGPLRGRVVARFRRTDADGLATAFR